MAKISAFQAVIASSTTDKDGAKPGVRLACTLTIQEGALLLTGRFGLTATPEQAATLYSDAQSTVCAVLKGMSKARIAVKWPAVVSGALKVAARPMIAADTLADMISGANAEAADALDLKVPAPSRKAPRKAPPVPSANDVTPVPAVNGAPS